MKRFNIDLIQSNFNITPGNILLSNPLTSDKRDVLLIMESSYEGVVGFVINNKTDLVLDDLLPDMGMFASKFPIFNGGMMQLDTLHMIHNTPEMVGGNKVGTDLYWGGSYEVLQSCIQNQSINPKQVKLLVGYAGWAAYDLEKEIEEGKWLLTNTKTSNILSHNVDDLWSFLIHKMGGYYRILSNVPKNISSN